MSRTASCRPAWAASARCASTADGTVVDAYPICTGTTLNCAGGATPWGTWLTARSIPRGQVWECDPTGHRAAVARPALGTFTHEAVAVDPAPTAAST